ncbi:MAG: hypothetical protein ABIQ99_09325 [Thermoflexales bacterium]
MAKVKRDGLMLGYWRITHMDQWDAAYVDSVVPGFFEFSPDGRGRFQFGTVSGDLDCRVKVSGGSIELAFTWEGQNDNDPGSGRGTAVLHGDEIRGHIFIHDSDDSAFTATRSLPTASKRLHRSF